MAEWIARLITVREVSQLNPGILPLLCACREYKRLPCWHQEVSRCHTRGESEESIAYRQQSMQARDPPWLWDPLQTSPEVQNCNKFYKNLQVHENDSLTRFGDSIFYVVNFFYSTNMHATNEYGTISKVAKCNYKKLKRLPTVIDASMESHRKASMTSGLF